MEDEEVIDLNDFDLEQEVEPYNRNSLVINVLLIIQCIVGLLGFIFTCWLIHVDQGGPAIGIFFFFLIIMGITIFLTAAKLWLKWFIIND